ncbi:DUF7507 domain-containing protein [Luteimonas gilva]|uniref:DUF7507 domain-containing protein n=1 Tax=Luteimonas gilva TaxID=2572684 RepID=UPI0016721E24|nr:Ig-like domain-containing protein [Luteimonas gilva]
MAVNLKSFKAAIGRLILSCALVGIAAVPAYAQNASNTATIAVPSGVSDPNTGNNSATDTDPIARIADLSVAKTDGVASVQAGGSTVYTITVSNNGPSELTGATVVDTAPAGLTIGSWTCAVTTAGTGGSVTTACGAASGTGNINTTVNLKNGAVITYTVNATVAASATGSIANTVTVAVPSGASDPTPANNSATDTNTVTPVANLAVTKTDGVASVQAGGSTAYTITVTNNGPSEITGGTVVDTAPAGLTIGGWTCTVTTVGTGGTVTTACGAASGTGNINTSVNMKNGAVITYTVNATVAGSTTGSVANTVTVGTPAGTTDPTPGNNSATDTNAVTPVANLAITKTDGVSSVAAGGSTVYTITVTNNGPSEITGGTVVDTAPAGLTIGNWTCAVATAGSGGTVTTACGAASGTGNINTTVTMKNGAVITYTVNATVSGSATGSIANTATVATPAGTNDPTPGNNSATDTNTITPIADLSIAKTDGATNVQAGGSTAYTITVTNNGPSELTGGTVVDTAPAGLTIGNWTCAVTTAGTGGSVTTACGAASGTGNINTTVNMKNGAVITYTVNATVSGSATGSIANTATVGTPAGTNDPTPGNNSATDTNTVTAVANLSVTKTDGATNVPAGGSTVYTIVVSNGGPSEVAGATVVDTAPAGLTIGNWTCAVTTAGSGGTVTTACGAASGTGNINTTVNLKNGAAITYTVNATVSGTATGSIANTVTVATPAGTNDPTPGDNTATDTNNVTAQADLSITKTDGATNVQAGGSTVYTIAVGNAGPSEITGATVVDTAPAGLTIGNWTCAVTTAGTGGSVVTACGAASGTGNINTTVNLKNGAVITYTVNATVAGSATGSIANTATVGVPAGANDPTPGNNNATDTNTVTPVANLSVTKTDGATSVPPGGSTVYTIVVSNAGPSEVTGATVVDTAPAGLTIGNWSCAVTTAGTGGTVATACGAASGTGNINTTVNMKNGAAITYTVNATVAASATGSIANTVTVAPPAGTTDPGPDGNTATDTNTVPRTADIAVQKTLTTPAPYVIGQAVTYSIVVTNNGPSQALNVGVSDTPSNLTITGVSGACTAFPCTIASINSGANATITVTGTVGNTSGAFNNTATATVPAGTTDPVPANNTDDAPATAAESADVSIVKTLTTAGPFFVGQAITYSLTVANAGPSTATSVQVTDTPTNLTIQSVSGACTALPCTIASLAPGANAAINVTATVVAAGAFDNSASANATQSDPNPANNTDNAGNGGNASASADVSVVKTLTTAGPYTIGQAVSFDIVVSNVGPSPATGINVADVPTNLTLGTVSGACAALPCTIASIASGASATITVTGTIQADGAFSNSATATPTENDPNTGNNTGTDGDNTTPTADIRVVKTLTTAGPYTIGQAVSFDIVVSNLGPSDANTVQVTDTPTNLTLGAVSGACTALPCTIASIASGASATITVAGTIQADGAFANSATATATETDPAPGNNTSTDGDNTTPTADIRVVKTLTTAGPYTIGQVVSFDIVVSNAGPSAATGVNVTDTPTNLTLGTVSGACTALPCTIASIASGASATITVTGTIQADGAFANSATATPTENDPNGGNNTSTDGDNTTPTADVRVVKTLTTAGPYTIGQIVSFDIVVSNAGPSAATNVSVADTPTNLTLGTISGACTALPCTIASIASGASATITVTGTIQADGAFGNSATATPNETDPNTGNNTSTDGDNTTPTADVRVVKTLTTAGPYVIGQAVTFDIVASNAGPSAATNVSVTDTPTNLTLGAVSGACTALPCTISSIASGSSATITVTGTIVADGAFGNSATATPSETDPNGGNNTSTDGDNTTPTADVSVVKTLTTAGPYTIGQTVSFDIVVSNAGPSAATNVSVTDTPTNLAITGVSGACTAMPCSIASIASGANATVTVTGTIQADGAFANSATATPTENDPNGGNNTSSDGDNTTPTADVRVVKTLTTAGPYVIGQTVSFDIVVSNAGPSAATNVSVTDTPTNLTLGTISGACTALPCSIASIASGASATITVSGTIQADGAFANSATATPTENDPNGGNNTSTDGDNTTPTADVSVVKTLTTAGPYVIGQAVSFDIVVSNAGPSTGTNVSVTDTPTNLTITAVSGAGCSAMPCTVASIASGASATITVTGTIVADGAFGNSATATPSETDPNGGNNTSTDGDNTTPTADVSVVKTLTTAGPYTIGQTVSFDIVVSNAGPSTATNVSATDTPNNLTITNVSGAGCSALPCTVASIASGASATITVTGTIDADGAFANSATATPAETDPNGGNNTGSDGDSTTPTADVSLAKTLTTAGPYLAGQAVQYSIVVANAGPSTATNVQVADTPTNLTITGVSGAGCSALPCTIASIASGASATITVNATIGATGGAFNNSATATGSETDPNGGNNTDDDPATASALPIVANPDSATTPQNTPVTVSVLGNDTLNGVPANPTTVTVTQASPPANGSIVVNPDGTIAYTPAPGFSGTDTYSYQICEIANPANCATATVTVTVQPNVVTAVDDSASTPANTPATISPLANDSATGAPLNPASVTITAQPAHGTVAVNPDGTVVYTPATNYLGADTFTYQVCDTSTPTAICDTAVVTVNVTGRPPVTGAAGDQGSGPAGQPVTIPVLANDSDPDGNLDPTTVVIVGAPGNGKSLVVPGQGAWTVNPDGSITFTPEPGFAGQATPIQYTVSDTTGLVSNPSTVNVTILGDVQLRVSKTASPRDVKIGDLVRYTVTIENVGVANANDATLVDTPPAGFSYVADSLTVVDGNGGGRLAGTYPIRVDQLDIAIGERATITYLLRVGAGVRPGVHTNHAFAQDGGATVSNEATADVQLVADPLLDESLLIGTVFDDRDGDGWQDRATLDGVRVQGGFAPGAYVAGSTTVDRGEGAKPEPDASAPLLHGIDLGKVAGRETEADTAAAHAITISQTLSALDFADDFVLTSKQGVVLRMDAAGNTRIERNAGDAAKGLTGAEPKVERRVSQVQGGYRVDYVVSNLGVDERGIPGVRIASVEGLLIETDQYGRYHLEGVAGGPWERGRNFILKVDPATLPPGSAFTTDNPLVRRITPGVPVRFDFGVKLPSGLIEGGKQDVEMELGEVMFAPGSAELRREHQPVIDKMAEQVQQHGGGEIVIAANGDTQALAYDRARAVQDALAKALTPEQLAALKISLRADVEDPHSALATVGGSTLLGTLLFDTDKADIRAEYRPLIEAIAADIEKRGGGVIGVVGHADRRGSDAYNVQLGLRRAKAVYEAIAAKLAPEARAKLRVEISDNPTAPVGIRGQ